jgi:hypothetical protein
MPDRAAPRVFISYAHDSEEHKTQVRVFAHFLRARTGLDVRLDQWDDHERRDWSHWAVDHLTNSDFIVVIASPDYRRRADGLAEPHDGRGSQFEAAIIRDKLTRNLREGTKQVLPVVLPGRAIEDIPAFLSAYSTSRFHVSEITDEGVSELVAAITGRARYPMPEQGEWAGEAGSRQVLLAGGVPWLARSSDIRTDSTRIDGIRYDDSIVLRPAELTVEPRGFVEVDLAGAYRWLTAVAGVPDDATEPFQVGRFEVYLDGDPRSENSAAQGKPAMVKVDVTGALRLRLEMYRPGVTASPLLSGDSPAGRLPELAWGNPTLS